MVDRVMRFRTAWDDDPGFHSGMVLCDVFCSRWFYGLVEKSRRRCEVRCLRWHLEAGMSLTVPVSPCGLTTSLQCVRVVDLPYAPPNNILRPFHVLDGD